jgi:dihydrodipicolinate synthase/N-acetylneuraminate lyase
MQNSPILSGIYGAVITPFDPNGKIMPDALLRHLTSLRDRGCAGILLAGTTGEGPSLTVQERQHLFKTVVDANTNMQILAGTGAASLEDAIAITRGAFDAGVDAVVVIPPYFFKHTTAAGLIEFYARLIERAVPSDGYVMLYHNPVATNTGLALDVIKTLRDLYPRQVRGIKDSGANMDYTRNLLSALPGLDVFIGDDSLLSESLSAGARGAITFVGGVFPDLARDVFSAFGRKETTVEFQSRLTATRNKFAGLPPIPTIKALLTAAKIIPCDIVRPPIMPLTNDEQIALDDRFHLNLSVPGQIDIAELLEGQSGV